MTTMNLASTVAPAASGIPALTAEDKSKNVTGERQYRRWDKMSDLSKFLLIC
jgi:hypothetical protein